MKLGEALVKAALITKQQLNQALERQVVFGGRIGTNIVELRFLEEEEFTNFLSKHFKLPAATTDLTNDITDEVTQLISREIAEKYKILPFRKERNRLHTALLNPKDIREIDELRFITGYDIIPYVISELRLLRALEKYYGIKRDLRYISFTDRFDADTKQHEEPPSLDKIKKAFTEINDAEEIAGILLNETFKIAPRVALFTVKGENIVGWKARGIDVDTFVMSVQEDSVFSTVLSKKSYYRGPVLRIKGNELLIKVLSGAPQDALLLPINLRERTVALLYVDNGNSSVLNANVSFLSLLASMAAVSFEIMILKKRILDMKPAQ